MSEKEKTICKNLEKALSSIPEAKKEYFLGFAEGVDAAKKKQEEADAEKKKAKEEAEKLAAQIKEVGGEVEVK